MIIVLITFLSVIFISIEKNDIMGLDCVTGVDTQIVRSQKKVTETAD